MNVNVVYTPGINNDQVCYIGRFSLIPGANFFTDSMLADIEPNELYQSLKSAGVITIAEIEKTKEKNSK
jgi:hypothetical protein